MRIVVQRVSGATVRVEDKVVSKIGRGLLLLIGVHKEDTREDALWAAEKCVHLRIFNDRAGKMNHSLLDTDGSVLAVSQFTLLGNTKKGRRPSFIEAAAPERGKELYDFFVERLKLFNVKVECGVFGAMMDVELINNGPVTLIVDSRQDHTLIGK